MDAITNYVAEWNFINKFGKGTPLLNNQDEISYALELFRSAKPFNTKFPKLLRLKNVQVPDLSNQNVILHVAEQAMIALKATLPPGDTQVKKPTIKAKFNAKNALFDNRTTITIDFHNALLSPVIQIPPSKLVEGALYGDRMEITARNLMTLPPLCGNQQLGIIDLFGATNLSDSLEPFFQSCRMQGESTYFTLTEFNHSSKIFFIEEMLASKTLREKEKIRFLIEGTEMDPILDETGEFIQSNESKALFVNLVLLSRKVERVAVVQYFDRPKSKTECSSWELTNTFVHAKTISRSQRQRQIKKQGKS